MTFYAAPLLPTIGVPELIIILVIVLIFFGVGKLPEIGRALGEGIKNFKEGQAEGSSPTTTTTKELDSKDIQDAEEVEPEKSPTRKV